MSSEPCVLCAARALVLERRVEFDQALMQLEELIRFRMQVLARDGRGILTDELFRALTLAVTCVKDRRQQLFPEDAAADREQLAGKVE